MAMGDAQLPVRITLLQLWLETWLYLSVWTQIGHSQYQSPPEVAIPLRVTSISSDMRNPGLISYSLHFGGQRHIIHLMPKKLLVSKDLSVFTYTDQGALLEDHPFIPTNCYYYGYVEGDPESLISLSTCLGGLRGVLHTKNIIYEIKPKSHSTTFEHLVYKTDSEETQFPSVSCALTDKEIERQLKHQEGKHFILMQSGYLGWWTHRWLLEMALVVDYERFRSRRRNISTVQDETILVFNEMNGYYKPLDISVVLCGLEIWNEENPIQIGTIYQTLSAFSEWKATSLNGRVHHDIAHLLANKGFGGVLGLAYVGTICNLKNNCGVNTFRGNKLSDPAYIMAHELGHNLGMAHDGNTCTCGQRWCIMFPGKVPARRFSNCSYSYLWGIYGAKNCLRNIPDPENIFRRVSCGNGVVEEGEECDCGSSQSCINDSCCSLSCTLKPGATCAFGLCCKNCQFMPSGTECRKQVNECDLPEWCNGTSPECPEDVYMQDGISCMGKGYCYEKRCNERDKQCQQIFGQNAKNANLPCYMQMNTKGNRFGNCGINTNVKSYVKCQQSNSLCGRIQCQNVTKIPLLRSHSTVHWAHINGITCWGTDYHLGMTFPDIGEVKDGTECGQKRVCINRQCVSMSLWRNDCSPATCNMNGVCNSKHHCHCNYQWDPPNCTVKGDGGSVDSGPPPKKIPEKKVVKRTFPLIILWIPILIYFYRWIFACRLIFKRR